MKTRIHIHRETISTQGETRHFIVKLPPDVEKVVAIKATAFPNPGVDAKKHHYEVGRLHFTREGFAYYEAQVRFEGYEPSTIGLKMPGMDAYRKTYVSGGKNEGFALEILNPSTVLFCRYENDTKVAGYTLAIYFTYEPKQKQ